MKLGWRNTEKTYGKVTIAFHWTIVLLILVQFLLAVISEDLSPAYRGPMMTLHKSLGIFTLLIASLRILWWLFDTKVLRLSTTPVWQARLARLVHLLLRIIVIIIPLSGWYFVSAYRGAIDVFGLFAIPPITQINPDFGRAMKGLHILSFWIFAGLLSLHIGAALFHHFIVKDNTLKRMLVITIPHQLPRRKKATNSLKVIDFPKKFKK